MFDEKHSWAFIVVRGLDALTALLQVVTAHTLKEEGSPGAGAAH